MNRSKKAKIRRFGNSKSAVRIGKNGVTEFLLGEISKRLDKKKVVKVKILKTALQETKAKDMAKKVAEATGSQIVELRGHAFTLWKPRGAKKIAAV